MHKYSTLFLIFLLTVFLSGCINKTSNNDVEIFTEDTESVIKYANDINDTEEEIKDEENKETTETEKDTPDSTKPEQIEDDAPEEEVPVLEEEVSDIEKWRVYEKEEKGIRIKYHKDWYYRRDTGESDLGYYLYVGFAPSTEILEEGSPYPIELIVIDSGQEFNSNLEYVKLVKEEDGKKYILETDNVAEYGEILSKMAQTLEKI